VIRIERSIKAQVPAERSHSGGGQDDRERKKSGRCNCAP
jgi:hypothetical protein